jgi:hypothetical protein
MLDGNFAENLYRGIDVRLVSHSCETWLCAICPLLIGAAVYKELR